MKEGLIVEKNNEKSWKYNKNNNIIVILIIIISGST